MWTLSLLYMIYSTTTLTVRRQSRTTPLHPRRRCEQHPSRYSQDHTTPHGSPLSGRDDPLVFSLADLDVAVTFRGGHRPLHSCLHARALGIIAAVAARQHQPVSSFGRVHRPELREETNKKSIPNNTHPRTCVFSTWRRTLRQAQFPSGGTRLW